MADLVPRDWDALCNAGLFELVVLDGGFMDNHSNRNNRFPFGLAINFSKEEGIITIEYERFNQYSEGDVRRWQGLA